MRYKYMQNHRSKSITTNRLFKMIIVLFINRAHSCNVSTSSYKNKQVEEIGK